jgi:hypothetical protein
MSTETKPDTSATDGKNIDGTATGAGTQTATTEARFTQSEVDRIIADRLKDQRERTERATKDAREKAEREANEKKALEAGEFQKVLEQKNAEVAELTAKAERADVLERRLHAIVDAKVASLPESVRALIPDAKKADAEARFAEIEKVETIMATVPTAAKPGNGRDPKPAGGADPAKQAERARETVAAQRPYSL